MKNRNTLKTSVLLLAGILAGGSIGLGIGINIGMKQKNMLSAVMEYEAFDEPFRLVLSEGECPAVKEALTKHITLVNKYKDIPETFFSGTIGYSDITISHARLARLEKKLGNTELSRSHIERAIEACRKAQWKGCSEEEILAISRVLEEKSPIPCIANDEK